MHLSKFVSATLNVARLCSTHIINWSCLLSIALSAVDGEFVNHLLLLSITIDACNVMQPQWWSSSLSSNLY